MLNYHLNTRFFKQFRHDYPVYLWEEQLHYPHFYFRQYTGNGKERTAIEKCMTKKWDDGKNTLAIIHLLKLECIPASNTLFAFTQKLVNRFQSYEKRHMTTTVLYHKMLPVLRSLANLENNFGNHVLQGSLQRMKNDSLDAADSICSEDVEALKKLTTHYLASVNEYYVKLNQLILPGSPIENKIALTSKDNKYLLKLRDLLEKGIYAVEQLNKQLQQWKIKLASRELRELYN